MSRTLMIGFAVGAAGLLVVFALWLRARRARREFHRTLATSEAREMSAGRGRRASFRSGAPESRHDDFLD